MVAKHTPERTVCQLGEGMVIPLALRTRAYFHHPMAVMTNVEGKVTVDSFERTRAVQAARPACPDAPLHRLFGQMLHSVSCAAACKPRLVMASGLPHARNMMKP